MLLDIDVIKQTSLSKKWIFASIGSAMEEKSSRKWKHSIVQFVLSMHIGQLRVLRRPFKVQHKYLSSVISYIQSVI